MNSFDANLILSTDEQLTSSSTWFKRIVDYYAVDEDALMPELCLLAEPNQEIRYKIENRARLLIENIRSQEDIAHAVDKLLQQYSLDNEEGVILMCLAEALMRIPDAETADALIHDKLSEAEWDEHLGKSDSLFVNASTWGLMLTGKVIGIGNKKKKPANLILLLRLMLKKQTA